MLPLPGWSNTQLQPDQTERTEESALPGMQDSSTTSTPWMVLCVYTYDAGTIAWAGMCSPLPGPALASATSAAGV